MGKHNVVTLCFLVALVTGACSSSEQEVPPVPNAAFDAARSQSVQSSPEVVTTSHAPAAPFPLTISQDKRRILCSNGQPVFMNGEAAWSLLVELTKRDVITYLDDRQAKGINTFLINLLEHRFSSNPPMNTYGEGPFTTPGDYATPNEAYFAHVDWVMQEMKKRKMIVLLVPSYLGSGGAKYNAGWSEEMAANGPAKMYQFGRYIGHRYKDFDNIIWTNGGDWNPEDPRLVDQMAHGIMSVDPNNLHSAHTKSNQNASDTWGSYLWFDIDNVYNYNDTYAPSKVIYQTNDRPFFMLESSYENEHGVSIEQIRAQAYVSILSGAIGHIFGNCPIWHFSSVDYPSCNVDDSTTWQSQLDSPGSLSMEYMGDLFRSRSWSDLVPDFNHNVMTGGVTSGGFNYSAAARTSNGNTVIAYIPSRRSITIDMTEISGPQAKAWWFNPANGVATYFRTFPTTGSQVFIPPTTNNDLVLVLDDASLNLAPPGSVSYGNSVWMPSRN